MWFCGSSRVESPGMFGRVQDLKGEGQAATDHGGPVFDASKFGFYSVGDEKSFPSWRDMVIYVLWKSHSTYTYGEQKSNREIGSKKTSRRLLLSGMNR